MILTALLVNFSCSESGPSSISSIPIGSPDQPPIQMAGGTNEVDADGTVRTDVIALAQEAGPASDEQCPNGVVIIELGIDSNGNRVLDADEVTGSEVVCNGRDGTRGQPGSPGMVGDSGPAGPQGPQGGQGEPGESCWRSVAMTIRSHHGSRW